MSREVLLLEFILLLIVAVAAGTAIGVWTVDRDHDLDTWSVVDVAATVVVTAVAGGIALSALWLDVTFGTLPGAVLVIVAWAVLLGLATSRRHPVLRRIVGLPIGIAVVVRGGVERLT